MHQRLLTARAIVSTLMLGSSTRCGLALKAVHMSLENENIGKRGRGVIGLCYIVAKCIVSKTRESTC